MLGMKDLAGPVINVSWPEKENLMGPEKEDLAVPGKIALLNLSNKEDLPEQRK
jgi:hypothetical protein